MPHLLLVEDDLTFSTLLSTWLGKKGFQVTTASTVQAAIKRLLHEEEPTQLVLSDLRLPDEDGLRLLQWLREQGRQIPFIVMTSYAEVQNAVAAMKLGATDYISKPVQPDILLEKIQEALKAAAASVAAPSVSAEREQTSTAGPTAVPSPTAVSLDTEGKGRNKRCAPKATTPTPGIEGSSAPAQELYRLASLVAPTPMSVLIIGASGTGKEYVAHRIHEQSMRKDGPFIALDCGALTKELAASELFGHVKGAFTGASTDKTGVFEQASGGTLFLDEVGNLSYDVQVQLLRALQERRVRPVGSTEERRVDIRLVCATNEDLPAAIARGQYREDLYHRINEFTLHIPLLRERGEDILEFAAYFLRHANEELGREVEGFTVEARQALLAYPWPGNLREMRNVIVRATLLAEHNAYIGTTELGLTACTPYTVATAAPLSAATATPSAAVAPVSAGIGRSSLSLRSDPQQERETILQALRQTNGNKSRAAQLLGIDRKTLYNKLKLFELEG